MQKRIWLAALLMVLPTFLLTTACSKKARGPKAGLADTTATRGARTVTPPVDNAEQARLEEEQMRELIARDQFVNSLVFFAYNSAQLDSVAQSVLREKAGWLHGHSGENIVIEGHCDERGTAEYNLALGERRAETARAFLQSQGIESTRMVTVSYGEERPVDASDTEEAWAKNRRAQFVIK